MATISDAAHAGAVPGFYFLPPMVPAPSYLGTFDGSLQPRVEICELVGTTCGTVIAQYTTTSGTGGQTVQVGTSSYQVNWHTNQFNLDPAKHYRISVYVGTFQLGFADVDVVSSGKELKNVDTQEYIPLQDDRTLPIKFRIETGIAAQVIVAPDSAAIAVGGTQQFTATVLDLHGNPLACAVTWSSDNTAVATVDASGLATGVAPGSATITATCQAASGNATLTVFNPNTPPVPQDDAFEAIGNVTVPVAAPGVLANDTDGENNPLSAVPGTFGTTSGGTVTINADGSFTYLSAPGFIGADSFTYTVTDGQDSVDANVTMTSTYRVWYVDNAAGPGDGRDASPFNTLAGAEAVSTAGETIFVRTGAAPYDGGITLKTGQSLTGQGVPANVTATLNGQTVVLLAAGSAPTITKASGATIQLAADNVVQGVNVTSAAGAGIAGSGFGTLTVGSTSVSATGGPALDLSSGDVVGSFDTLSSAGSTGAGIRLVGVGGSFSAAGGSITGSVGAGADVTGGAGTFSYGGDIAVAGPLAVSVTGRTGGALTFSGTIASTGSGISVQNNVGGTIAFTGSSKSLSTGANPGVNLANNAGATISFGGGGLAIATTTGAGFQATGGGTVSVTGAGNTVTSTGGVAVRVENTTIGASGLTFRSVSANGGANGIVLNNTGVLNGMQVTGDGTTAGSGGTIQNTGIAGLQVTDARNVEVHLVNFINANTVDGGGAGVCDATTNAGCNGAVKLLNVVSVTLDRVVIDGAAEQGITGRNVTGITVSGSAIEDAGNDATEGGIYLAGVLGTTNTISGTSVVRSGGRNLLVRNSTASNPFPGTADVLTVSGSTFTNAGLNGATDGVLVALRDNANFHTVLQGSTVSNGGQECVQIDAATTARSRVTATGNSVSGCNTALALTASGTSATTFDVTANPLIRSVSGAGVLVGSTGSAGFRGTVANNPAITTSSASNSGAGVDVVVEGTGSAVVEIANNVITGHSIGFRGGARAGTGTADLTIRDNTVTAGGSFPFTGVYLFAGNGTPGEVNSTCTNLVNNQVSGGGGFNTDYVLEQYAGNTMELQGLVPAAGATPAQVAAFVSSRDVGGATVEPFGGAVVAMTDGTCATP
ncbi:MAG TPA: Ig-like domain-containing protein [Longimicrobium sp.]|nr:Ig-like domain-containing protein [Longimicrobium sp.]